MTDHSIVERTIDFSGLFESEVLTELLLRYYKHPLADDKEFRNNLLEAATGALRHAAAGMKLIDSLPAMKTNFIVAIWYSEGVSISTDDQDIPTEMMLERKAWLERIQRLIPSCFQEPEE
ncbi:hypothetical protein [Gimesia aquarii]|uniref:Uncharacterized protein n=1 Tax=Gimesia aquarii TaxID=2527964 RepID=A0A517X190_9PLAN|nr:hypothetical protein [Gimesia aquarii]QDU11277.1 hypothetical protein V202x_46960 [Gimesia aquarii]